jgi:uncharacterized membrane protein YgdD (TMEM256/DUF423 family)
MKIAVLCLLALDALNFGAFVALAVVGYTRGVSDPFPPWFRNGSDLCFYAALALLLVSLPFWVSVRTRFHAFISGCVSAATAMLIAFLTTRG